MVGITAVAVLLAVVFLVGTRWFAVQEPEAVLTYEARKTDLTVTVTERGNLESQETVSGICELESGQNKIIFLVEEGTQVKKGDAVVRFDSSEIEKEIAEQKIKVNQATKERDAAEQELEVMRNQNESDIAAAELELQLAELDLRKYREGDYLVKLNELKGKIALAEFEKQKALDAEMHMKELVKSGYREPEQLQAAKQNVESAKFNLQRDKETLRVLENYEYERSLTEFDSKAKEAKRKLARTKASCRAKLLKAQGELESTKAQLELRQKRLAEYEEQKCKCEIVAEQSGIVAYANREWYDESRRIREGAVVHYRQTIFHLPDMSAMQVKVNVHESVVKKLKEGQKATIRVEAFSNLVIEGTVKKVSPLADSSNSWIRGGVKEYATIVVIDEMPEVPLRPGMTAEVEIAVGTYPDVLAVPVQAITEYDRSHYAYVQDGGEFRRRPVDIGESNYKLVEVTSGLGAGDIVALDARVRAAQDFDDLEITDDAERLLPSDELPGESTDATTTAKAQPAANLQKAS